MPNPNNFKMFSYNMEVLRDFVTHFPKDFLYNGSGWKWWVDEYNRLHLCQDHMHRQIRPNLDEVFGILDIMFEGDGVMVFSLQSTCDGVEIARGLYDDHCLDNGKKFKRYITRMDPLSRDFDPKLAAALKAYHDAYWHHDGCDESIVIGNDHQEISYW